MANDKSKAILDGVVDYLKETGNEDLLPRVAHEFEQMAREAGLATEIDVRSVVALTEKQKKDIAETIKKQQGIDLPVRNTVEPDLIGGMTIRVGDWLYDGSVKSELVKMKDALLS